MPSTSTLLLLPIFLLFASEVSSYDHDKLKTKVKYEKPAVSPAPVATHPPPPPVVKTPTTPPPAVAPPPPAAPVVKSSKDCAPLCEYRCQLHSRKSVCMRACRTCCDRCKCVPPGTYGNRQVCGKCYTDMLTHGNRPKCP